MSPFVTVEGVTEIVGVNAEYLRGSVIRRIDGTPGYVLGYSERLGRR